MMPPLVGVMNRTNKRNGERLHGSRAKYVIEKCRCEACRKANSESVNMRYRLKVTGQYQPFVDAEPARRRINYLVLSGLRIKADICRITGMSQTTLWKIRKGIRRKVTPETLRRLMELDPLVIERGGSYVPADELWETVYRIMECGYSKAWIARRLGRKAPALQIGTRKIKRGTADAIQELYRFARVNPAPAGNVSSRSKNYAKKMLRNAEVKLQMREHFYKEVKA